MTNVYDILDRCRDYTLSDEDSESFQTSIDTVLVRYRALNIEARDSNLKRWNEVPKHHFAYHLAEWASWRIPRLGWCYPDEDFMRIMKACLRLLASTDTSIVNRR